MIPPDVKRKLDGVSVSPDRDCEVSPDKDCEVLDGELAHE